MAVMTTAAPLVISDKQFIRRIANAACVDHRSVRKQLAGEHVRGRAGERIRAAIAALSVTSSPAAPVQEAA